MLCELKIYDIHFDIEWEPELNDLVYKTHEGMEWLKFNIAFNPETVKIDCFREFVLFDSEKNPIECTKVYLNDGSVLYACMTYIQFRNFYNKINETNTET